MPFFWNCTGCEVEIYESSLLRPARGFSFDLEDPDDCVRRIVRARQDILLQLARGLYPLLLFALHRQLIGGPYRRAEFSWVLEDNHDINRPAEQAGARRYKTYRIYEKHIG